MRRATALAIAAASLASLATLAITAAAGPARAPDGDALYDRYCLACHGAAGDGEGPAAPWLWPQPRDLVSGEFKWRSTPSGEPPARDDLARAIRYGVPGTSMHGFAVALDDAQIAALVGVVERFAKLERTAAARPPVTPRRPADARAAIERGRALYKELGCDQCHGATGRGDGPSAPELRDSKGRPAALYDLTAVPLRRPRAPGSDGAAAVFASLVTGLTGTPMPAYAGAAPDNDLWAVALYIDSIRARDRAAGDNGPSTVDPIIFDRDRRKNVVAPGRTPNERGDEARVFGQVIALQGPPPRNLAPAQASLDARRCERCHAKQAAEWKPSFHAGAGSPGLIAQLLEMEARGDHQEIEGCQRCHAPLAEQHPGVRLAQRVGGDDRDRRYVANPAYDPALRDQGINCASCHVRGWRRFGPPRVAEAKLLDLPGYPLTELALYERADFCAGCHQLPPRTAVAGKPRLNTYREWLEGPYMRRGIQCQHCHMPNREHTWKGVHDPDTFRQGIEVEVLARRNPATGAVTVRARVTNVGAGHYLPTTPTPAAWVSVELVDRGGRAVDGARAERRIGWHLAFERGAWKEIEDTRIPPGQSLELARAWRDGRVPDATHARVIVRVHPDDFYEGLYAGRLARKPTGEVKHLYEQALDRARGSHYVAFERLVPIR